MEEEKPLVKLADKAKKIRLRFSELLAKTNQEHPRSQDVKALSDLGAAQRQKERHSADRLRHKLRHKLKEHEQSRFWAGLTVSHKQRRAVKRILVCNTQRQYKAGQRARV